MVEMVYQPIRYHNQDMGIFTVSKIGWAGMLGALFGGFFLFPKSIAPFTVTIVLLLELAGLFLRSIWVQSQPNQWMLVIKNGELKKGGIGLKTLVWPGQNVVKFPSAVQRVEFSAKNVTREMLGVEVEGVAFWSVNRKGQGPFNCYKYMQGGVDANSSVRTVCESIVRNEMANCSLQEVLRERTKLKERMRRELQAQLDGWGIWLESVDLKDVKICSNTLFEDLQAEFRLATQLKAEQVRLSTSERVTESRLQSQIKIGQATQQNSTQVMKARNIQNLKRQQNTSDFKDKVLQIQKKRIIADKDLTFARMKSQQELEEERVKNDQALQKMRLDFENANVGRGIEIDKTHNEVSLQKYAIDSTERVYKKLATREIKVSQFVGDTKNVVASLLPGLQFAIAQGRTVDS